MKEIIILGGGFAGIAAIKNIQKQNIPDIKITLIDKNSYHLFTPTLYEVATSEEPQKNAVIPFEEIFGNKITIVHGSVEKIDTNANIISYKNDNKTIQKITFDYLLIALGSEPAYFGIPGLKENSLSLKTLPDAIKIKNKIKSLCCKEGLCDKKVKLIIGGGGFSGTELAGEMLMYKNRLAKQNHLDIGCLEIAIIQGSDKLLKELDSHVSDIAQKRIAGSQTQFLFGGHITKVTSKTVDTDNGYSYRFDILVWTGGVTANHLAKDSNLELNKHGQIVVNEFLQVPSNPNIFVVGDIAGFLDSNGNAAPGVAQVAEGQGKVAGQNIIRVIKKQSLLPYKTSHWGYIVPIKGHFAAAELMGWLHLDGFSGWILQQLVFFWYLLHILPFYRALKRWNRFEKEMQK